MSDGWATIQLHESVNPEILQDSLLSILPEAEIFFPFLKYTDKRGKYIDALFDGYAFVRGENYEGRDYIRLENSPYVQCVLKLAKHVAYTSDMEIQKLKDKLSKLIPADFLLNEKVYINKGLFNGLTGTVIQNIDDKLILQIEMPLGSLTKITTIPKLFVESIKI